MAGICMFTVPRRKLGGGSICSIYSQTTMARTSLGSKRIVRDMGSSSH